MSAEESAHPFSVLEPSRLLDMLEAVGLVPDGRLLALNSYENRVYQLGIEDAEPVILKVYRPDRWSQAAIAEEHAFAQELAESDIPVVPPAVLQGRALHRLGEFCYAVYPRRGGHAPPLDDPDTREWLGRMLGRLHQIGGRQSFAHRPDITEEAVSGRRSRDYLLSHHWIPPHIELAYQSVTEELLVDIAAAFERAGSWQRIRLHGDFHPGNILWTDLGPHVVDLDDCMTGPAIQDLWMMLSGDRSERTIQLGDILAGYEQFCDFDPRELHLVGALRTLRMMHHAAWLARRWDDPAFPAAFTWFNTDRYWEEHILALREQAAAMQEPVLAV